MKIIHKEINKISFQAKKCYKFYYDRKCNTTFKSYAIYYILLYIIYVSELIKNSSVYANTKNKQLIFQNENLAETILFRKLLPLIFTKEAILKCTFFAIGGQHLPGLNKHAAGTLIGEK